MGLSARPEWLAVWEKTGWKLNLSGVSASELMLAGGILLMFAAVLLLLRKPARTVVMESSEVTEEILRYLARIAKALEEPRKLSEEASAGQMLRRLLEEQDAKAKGKIREFQLTK
jgi:hypothetical protein